MGKEVKQVEFLGYKVTTSNRTERSHLIRSGFITLCGKDTQWSDWQHGDNAAPFDTALDCKACLKIVNQTYQALER